MWHFITLYRITNLYECFEYTNKQFTKKIRSYAYLYKFVIDTGISEFEIETLLRNRHICKYQF